MSLLYLAYPRGVANGAASLDAGARVPYAQSFLSPGHLFPQVPGDWHQPGFSSSTNNGLAVGTSRAFPWFFRTATTITAMAYEVATIGDASAAMRLDVYADDASGPAGWPGLPGVLIGSAGSVAGATAAVQAATGLTIAAPAGWAWVSGTLLGSGAQPTVRTIGTVPTLLSIGSTTPTSLNGSYIGYFGTGGTGAAPSPFGAATRSTAVPRIAFKI